MSTGGRTRATVVGSPSLPHDRRVGRVVRKDCGHVSHRGEWQSYRREGDVEEDLRPRFHLPSHLVPLLLMSLCGEVDRRRHPFSTTKSGTGPSRSRGTGNFTDTDIKTK